MATLSGASSIFQLAFAINLVFPILISDYEAIREKVADSIVRKIRKYKPDFEIDEEDKINFLRFVSRSSSGLKHANFVTLSVAIFSLVMCTISLGALFWSAVNPNREIPDQCLFGFTIVTCAVAPFLYAARNSYLKFIYSANIEYGCEGKAEAEVFAGCFNAYADLKKKMDPLIADLDERGRNLRMMLFRATFRMKIQRYWLKIRSYLQI